MALAFAMPPKAFKSRVTHSSAVVAASTMPVSCYSTDGGAPQQAAAELKQGDKCKTSFFHGLREHFVPPLD